jgi:signal transduction histidine kinase
VYNIVHMSNEAAPNIEIMRDVDIPTSEMHEAITTIDISSMEIKINRENIIMSTDEGERVYSDHELQLFRPVIEYIEKKMQDIPQLDGILKKINLKNTILPFWFEQSFPIVLREILVNSMRAIQEKASSEGEGRIEIKSFLDEVNRNFVISVVDNGIGLKGQDKKKMFKEGYTTKKTFPKSTVGNGMYRSKAFVEELLGGKIEIFDNEKELGLESGATCNILIPLNN